MKKSSFYITDQEQLIAFFERLKSEAEQGTLQPITLTASYKDGATVTYRLGDGPPAILDRPDEEPH